MEVDRTQEAGPSPGFDHYVRSIAKNWWLILLVAVVAAAISGVLASRRQTEYRARASIALAPAPTVADTDQQLDALLSMKSQLTTTLAKVVASGGVQEAAGDGAYLDELDRDELELTAHEIPNSLVVEVNVTGEDPGAVGGFIEAVIDASAERFEELYEVSLVQPLDPAPVVGPSRLSVRRTSVVAGTVGLGAGFLLGLARDALGRTRRSKRDRR